MFDEVHPERVGVESHTLMIHLIHDNASALTTPAICTCCVYVHPVPISMVLSAFLLKTTRFKFPFRKQLTVGEVGDDVFVLLPAYAEGGCRQLLSVVGVVSVHENACVQASTI